MGYITYLIPDDPVVRSFERTGQPPKPYLGYTPFNARERDIMDDDEDFEGSDGDVYYGNSSEDF